MSLGIQQDIVRLDVTMDNSLRVDISQSTTQLSYPEAHCLLCETFPRDVEPQVTTIHQIHHNVSSQLSATKDVGRVELGELLQDAHIFNVLETVSQIAKERMVQVLEHPPFTDDIPYAFRPNHYMSKSSSVGVDACPVQQRTFFFPNVL